MRIFKRIESHYETLITDPNNVEPLRLIVMGTAGTGKSYLINMIRDHLWKITRNRKVNSQSPILMLVLTRVAAFNIHGVMIYSALSILIFRNNFDLNGERLKILQKKLEGVVYLVIDKKSMVG